MEVLAGYSKCTKSVHKSLEQNNNLCRNINVVHGIGRRNMTTSPFRLSIPAEIGVIP